MPHVPEEARKLEKEDKNTANGHNGPSNLRKYTFQKIIGHLFSA